MRPGYRLSKFTGREVGPTQVKAFGQYDDAASLIGRLPNRLNGSVEIRFWPSSFNEDLSHAEWKREFRHGDLPFQ